MLAITVGHSLCRRIVIFDALFLRLTLCQRSSLPFQREKRVFSALPELTRWLHPQIPNNSSLGRLCPSGAALILYPSVPGERDQSNERPERGPPAPSHPIQLTAQPEGVLETSTSFLLDSLLLLQW